jgi:hypothetical protein
VVFSDSERLHFVKQSLITNMRKATFDLHIVSPKSGPSANSVTSK